MAEIHTLHPERVENVTPITADTHSSYPTPDGLCDEIRKVLEKYFSMNPHLSPVSFAFKIQLQEKRIFELLDKSNERPPTLTEIVAILTSIHEGKTISELARELPGAIGNYIRHEYQYFIGNTHSSTSGDLVDLLKRKENYIIYKLAANREGVELKEVQRLFGVSGVENAKYMLRRDILRFEGSRLYAKIQNFTLPNDMFVDCLKFTADFISTGPDKQHKNIFGNLSESLNEEAYQRVVKVQREALQEIINIMQDSSSKGDIPTFVLSAIDILE